MKKNVFFLSLALMIGLSTWTAKAGNYGDGDLTTIINGATANEVINLTGTTYTYSVAATLDKTLTIQADASLSSRPVITCTFASAGVLFTAAATANQTLTLKGLEFKGNSLATCLTKTNVTYKFTVSVDNCKTSGFVDGTDKKMFSYTACAAGTTNGDLTVSNSEFVGPKPNSLIGNAATVITPNNISFTNCLIRDFASANASISIASTAALNGITLDHCTFKNGSTGTAKLISTPTSNAPMLVKNCIFVDIPSTGVTALQANANNQKNVVYNIGTGGTGGATQFVKFGSVTYPLLTTNPALNATTFVTGEATYQNAGSDGITIGYNVPVAAVAPSAPTALTFTTPANATSLSVSFTAGYNGGSPITNYKYSIDGGTSFTSAGVSTSPITIPGLSQGTSYNIQIKAVNSVGDGAASATAIGRTSQTVVYVSTTGNDTNDGLTVGTPVATFARAIAISCPATTNIYLAAGNYVQTTTASLNALSNINLTISGESASNTTISTATSAVRLLIANNTPFSASNNTVTIRNLTFSGANITANGAYGGAIQFNQGAANTMQSSLILENMIFDNNKITVSGANAGAGGALSTNFKNVTITGCYFKNNQALTTNAPATGGAIFVGPSGSATGDASGSFVNISNTTFDGNVATSKGGAVLVNNNVGPATLPAVTPYAKFTNCTFVNNKVLSQPTDATTNIKNGSAICFNSTTTAGMYQFAYTIANCTFAKNQGGTDTGTGSVWESKSAVQFDGTNWTSATLVNNIFAPSLTANCGTTLSVSDAESTKFTAEYNAIESVDALASDATFGVDAATNHNTIAALDPSNLNAALTDNTAGAVFAVPYLGLPYASAAKNAGVDTYTGGIVPTLDVRGQAIVGTKDLGAFENAGTANSVISTTGTLSAVNTTYGTASASPTTFSVSGADMTASILVTPPAGYEVSLSSGSGYASTVTVTGTGTISSTPVHVRLAATTAVGSYSGNIVLSSTGATDKNVATVSSSVTAAAANKTGGDITALGLTDTELANTDVTITSGELVVNTGKTVRSITVNGGAKLTVPAGQTLTLTNLTLKSNDTSTATYKPEGTGALVVTGSTAVEQYLATTRNWYVSSPVNNALAPEGYTYFSRDESGSNPSPVAPATAYWVSVVPGAGLTAGKGYIALPSNAALPITFTTENGGSLNNGTITIPLTYTSAATSGKGYNLIGNPYPSHLSWTPAFAIANTAKIDASIWYRTNSSGSNATGWSFVTYNPITGEAVPSTTNGGLIPPMQAFWVLAKNVENNSIQFTNDMRSHQTGNPLRVKAAQSADRKKVRLQVSNGTRADEALIVFDANASDSYDAYDSPKMMNNATDIADIYTVVDAKKLVINGMSSLKYNTEIPVGFSTLVAGDFSISANELSNFETDAQVVLLDKELTKEFDLSKGTSYNFSSGITASNANRFSLLFRAPSSPNALNTVEKLNAQVFVNAANQITIVTPEKANYAIYNAVGMLLENGQTTAKLQTVNCKLQTGMYVVRVSENGKELTTIVIIK